MKIKIIIVTSLHLNNSEPHRKTIKDKITNLSPFNKKDRSRSRSADKKNNKPADSKEKKKAKKAKKMNVEGGETSSAPVESGKVKLTKNKKGGDNKQERNTKRKGGFFNKRNNRSSDKDSGDKDTASQQSSVNDRSRSIFTPPVFEKMQVTPKPSRQRYKKTSESDLFGGKESPVSGNYLTDNYSLYLFSCFELTSSPVTIIKSKLYCCNYSLHL